MALPIPGPASRGLVSFRLFGIPVSIHASFLVIAFVIGASGPVLDVGAALVWVAVITVSVLAHELGHAFLARPVGGEPRIDLYAIAGLTRWNAARASRARRVVVSIAGPAAGVAFGLALIPVYLAVDPGELTLLAYAFEAALFANLFWGLVNLLPMLPLDGGQIALALMPGRDDGVRVRRTAWLSIGVAVAAAAGCFLVRQPFLGVFVLVVGVFGNVSTVRAVRRIAGAPRDEPLLDRASTALQLGRAEEALATARRVDHPVARIVEAAALLRLGQEREAQHLLLDLPDEVRMDPVFEAAVLLANGQERLARERLATALPAAASAWGTTELAALLLRRGDDVDPVFADVRGEPLVGVATALFEAGEYERSARYGERALGSGSESWLAAYNVACAWARAGDADRGLRALDHAILLGFADGGVADADDDLAPLRTHPGWAAVRGRIG